MKKILVSSLAILSLGFILTGCTDSPTNKDETKDIKIMTTFYPMYEFTKQVVGDEAEVELMITAGTEAHDYEPSAKDIAKITDAQVFIYNSHEFETWVADVTDNIDTDQTTVVEAAGEIELMEGSEEEEDHGHDHAHEFDPHVWLSPVLAVQEVKTIQEALSQKYPELSETFEENADAYIKELNSLNDEFTNAFSGAANRDFVTQHAAFGYLAHQYDLNQVAISGLSPDQEPTASRLAELKEYVTEHKIEYIYFEENAKSNVAETLANEANVQTLVLNPLESLTTKQMEAGENYISVMKENLTALAKSIH